MARIADQLEIPHPLEDNTEADDGDLLDEEREMFARKPLDKKIEILLLMIAKNCLGTERYFNHIKVLKLYRETNTHANEIETGTLRLRKGRN